MNIGFTGSQHGMTQYQKDSLADSLEFFGKSAVLHHGDCIGADDQAHGIAVSLGLRVVIHPPVNPKKRAYCSVGSYTLLWPKDYLDRNHDIVDDTEVLIVAPRTDQEELRSGTWATYRYAKKLNRQIIFLHPSKS